MRSCVASYMRKYIRTVCDSKKLTFRFFCTIVKTICIVINYKSFNYEIVFLKNITMTQRNYNAIVLKNDCAALQSALDS